MTDPTPGAGTALPVAHPFDIEAAKARLSESGGYPEPDRPRPHDDDDISVVLEGER